MIAYEIEVPDKKEWDNQTSENMVENVTKGKSPKL